MPPMTQQLKYHCLVAQGAQVVLPRPPCLICPCDNHPPNLRCVQRFRPLAGGHCQVALWFSAHSRGWGSAGADRVGSTRSSSSS